MQMEAKLNELNVENQKLRSQQLQAGNEMPAEIEIHKEAAAKSYMFAGLGGSRPPKPLYRNNPSAPSTASRAAPPPRPKSYSQDNEIPAEIEIHKEAAAKSYMFAGLGGSRPPKPLYRNNPSAPSTASRAAPPPRPKSYSQDNEIPAEIEIHKEAAAKSYMFTGLGGSRPPKPLYRNNPSAPSTASRAAPPPRPKSYSQDNEIPAEIEIHKEAAAKSYMFAGLGGSRPPKPLYREHDESEVPPDSPPMMPRSESYSRKKIDRQHQSGKLNEKRRLSLRGKQVFQEMIEHQLYQAPAR